MDTSEPSMTMSDSRPRSVRSAGLLICTWYFRAGPIRSGSASWILCSTVRLISRPQPKSSISRPSTATKRLEFRRVLFLIVRWLYLASCLPLLLYSGPTLPTPALFPDVGRIHGLLQRVFSMICGKGCQDRKISASFSLCKACAPGTGTHVLRDQYGKDA